MLPDPITVTAASPTPELHWYVVASDNGGSIRRHDGTDLYELVIQHVNGRGKSADRHYMQIKYSLDAENPYTEKTQRQTASVSLSISVPPYGFDSTAMVALVKALTDTLADAEVTTAKLLNFQS